MDMTVHLHKDEPASILVSLDGVEGHAVWLPKSQIEITPRGLGAQLSLVLPDWLARSKGLLAKGADGQMTLL